jgi:exodeoxyribonuclease VII large subunit
MADMDRIPTSSADLTATLGGAVARPQPPTVSQLTERIKQSLEIAFPDVWVAGEISNFSRPASGHVYFTLKDDRAQLRATIWQSTAARLKFDFRDGLEVVCHGEIDVYPPRGSYQLIVRRIEPVGLGALQLAFRQLHQRLSAEGLFDPRRKRPLPRFPRRVAFVTSPTGAAIRDFLEVMRRGDSERVPGYT